MTTQQMRQLCWGAYAGGTWHLRVDKMPDDQIVALYHSLVKQGRINLAAHKSSPAKQDASHTRYSKKYYHTCEHCGANLDPNEKCDCEES